ncbi:toxin-antitoxin system TumE family protein [Halococcus salifodinae]|uniref:Sugar metabolism cluster protein n=1 Tax=Halococcus salifodinae DSM 8989 TaxID=1227456 RepID=M0MWN0_9EURY|nr:DUF6516 family protein [Halococcus salifodinae]EMA48845.1 hypothetical protein C450_18899 [Halococcus salifodinae DSM 8989]
MSGPLELNRAVPGGRVEMFAILDASYPGGWFYRFQYYHPEDGEILRYDNAHDDETLGNHHRHVADGEDTALAFQSLVAHVSLFFTEIARITEETTND